MVSVSYPWKIKDGPLMVRSLPFYLICSLMLFAPLAYIGTSQD
ncbi:hypothetical protein JCM19232_644 [Vibrio ishigakensis]|uniref:Uncharacterized protein n=1 Tax=Vibrio ishigakensis TaxID=1481914 RepID=A0A0B8P266_9VIBR|nr:hypothetical protein JCM19232_644 [Vibrio ishigakensis]